VIYNSNNSKEDTRDKGLSNKNDALDDEPKAKQDNNKEEIIISRFPNVSKESF
jgi:hypothetical protein